MVICESMIWEIGDSAPSGVSLPLVSRGKSRDISYARHVDDFHLINTTVLAQGIPRFPAKTCDGMRPYASGLRFAKINDWQDLDF